MVTKRERKSLAIERKIIESASVGFTKRPINLVAVDDIVYNAGVSRSCLYYRYYGKESLFAEVVEDQCMQALKKIRLAVSHQKGGANRLRAYAENRIANTWKLARYIHLNPDSQDKISGVRESYDRFVREENILVANILEYGVKRGEFVVENRESTARTIVQTVAAIELRWLEGISDFDEVQKIACEMIEIIIQAFMVQSDK